MNAALSHGPVDYRALLSTIRGRLVRAVITEDSPYAKAVLEVVVQRSRRWSHEEWQAALAELATSKQTVEEFLAAEHARRPQ